jgi:hypothetical protein
LIHIERDTDAEEKIDLERGLRSDSIPQRS